MLSNNIPHPLHPLPTDDPAIAARWKLAAEALAMISSQKSPFGQVNDLREIPLSTPSMELIEATQIAARYIMQSMEATRNANILLAQQLTQQAQAIRDSSSSYRYWTTQAQQEALKTHHVKASSALQLASTYRTHATKAIEAQNHLLAQQWAEAACLAQETASRAKKAQALEGQIGNEILANRWIMAASWSYSAAHCRAKVAEALEQEDSFLAQHWNKITASAEDASTYRAKAATITLENPTLAESWITAAYWAGNVSLYEKQALEAYLANNEKLYGDWTKAASDAQQAFRAHEKASKNSHPWLSLLTYYWNKIALQAETQAHAIVHELLNYNSVKSILDSSE